MGYRKRPSEEHAERMRQIEAELVRLQRVERGVDRFMVALVLLIAFAVLAWAAADGVFRHLSPG